MSNITLTTPGAFPARADPASGKTAVPDSFMLSESPLYVPPPDRRAGGGPTTVQPRISLGPISIHSRCDKTDVEALIEKRELWLARRLVSCAESGVKY